MSSINLILEKLSKKYLWYFVIPLSDFVVKLQNIVTQSFTNQPAGMAGKTLSFAK